MPLFDNSSAHLYFIDSILPSFYMCYSYSTPLLFHRFYICFFFLVKALIGLSIEGEFVFGIFGGKIEEITARTVKKQSVEHCDVENIGCLCFGCELFKRNGTRSFILDEKKTGISVVSYFQRISNLRTHPVIFMSCCCFCHFVSFSAVAFQ